MSAPFETLPRTPGPDRRCIVLGGSGALGGAVCRWLHARNAKVFFTWNKNAERAEVLQRELTGVDGCQLDVRENGKIETVINAAAAKLGGVDALINCVGIGLANGRAPAQGHVKMGEIVEAEWDEMQTVNIKAAFFACRAVLPHLTAAGGGNIVLTGSIDGVKPLPAPVHYSAAKAALVGLVKAMSKELGPKAICTNVVAPGVMEQGVSRTLPANLLAEYNKHSGLGRPARLEEVASVICWLALENTHITGQTILLDGAL